MPSLARAPLALAALLALCVVAPLAAAHPDDECPSGLAAARMSTLGSMLGRRLPPPSSCTPGQTHNSYENKPSLSQRLARQALQGADQAAPDADSGGSLSGSMPPPP